MVLTDRALVVWTALHLTTFWVFWLSGADAQIGLPGAGKGAATAATAVALLNFAVRLWFRRPG